METFSMGTTGMPIQGRVGMSTPFTGSLSSEHQAIIEAGIPLFELQKPKVNHMGERDFGPFNVVVKNEVGANSTIEQKVDWMMGNRATIMYEPNKMGFCYGYCPDDPWWHNRIWLASNITANIFLINRYITEEGLLPSKRITDEIRFIEQYIHDWKVMFGKEFLFRSKDMIEAREFARNFSEKNVGKQVQVIYAKIKEIEDIMHGGDGPNWLVGAKFQQESLPKLKEAVADKFKKEDTQTATPIDLQNEIDKYIRNLPQQKRIELLSGKEPEKKKNSLAGKDLDKLTEPEAMYICNQNGISHKGMDLPGMIAALKDKFNIKFEFVDEQGEVTDDPEKLPFGDGTQVVDFSK
jgi:hypothetical protein